MEERNETQKQQEALANMRPVSEPKAYFTVPLPNGDTRHVAAPARFVWVAAAVLVLLLGGLLVNNLQLRSVTREYRAEQQAFTEYKAHKAEQDAKLGKLLETNEKLLRDMSELHALETKLRRAVIYNDGAHDFSTGITDTGVSRTDPNYLGQGGGTLDTTMVDVVAQQQINMGHEMQAVRESMTALLDEIETKNGHKLAIPDYWPTEGGEISSPYGGRRGPIGGGYDFHPGIDIAVDYGTPVYAAASGTVLQAGWNGGYGRYVKISHGYGYETAYGHMSGLAVSAGATVKKGDLIGFVGSSGYSTGPHLHFELIYEGKDSNPLHILQR